MRGREEGLIFNPMYTHLKRIRKLEVDGRNGCGRLRKTWEQLIKEDLCVKGLRSEAA